MTTRCTTYLLLFLSFYLVVNCGNIKDFASANEELKTNNISYTNTIKPIIESYCITCHSGENPAADFVLNTYEAVRRQTEKGELLQRINDRYEPMPTDGLMPVALRQAIQKWAENGFKQHTTITTSTSQTMEKHEFTPPKIVPIDINYQGFDFFELMQGHWIGKMNIMGQKYDWFSFDYRPIAPSHIHGIYEGGTVGNLLTSFFISNYNGKRTIMARNGGILNGIYRMSYFVLDHVEQTGTEQYFRFVDAYGGKEIMWMELSFKDDRLSFNSYTSRFGLKGKPKQHMKFDAVRKHSGIAKATAQQLNYPKNIVDKDFSTGFPKPNWGNAYPTITSASYMHRDTSLDLKTLGELAGDPYNISEIPYLARLAVDIEQNAQIKNYPLIIYLSQNALTDNNGKLHLEYGQLKQDLFDSIFLFPDLAPNTRSFTFDYLHPGQYYITVLADLNQDGYVSKGDITSKSIPLIITPNSSQTINIKDILNRN